MNEMNVGNATVTQGFLYAPFGEIIDEYVAIVTLSALPKYAFNAKELDEETGMYYYEARYYNPPVFVSRDPHFERYFWHSPYAYCGNNPMKYVDPSGCSVVLTGEKMYFALDELTKGAKNYGIKIKMDQYGNISGKYKGRGSVSSEAQTILNAINDRRVNVVINATDKNTTKDGIPFFGGAFLGSTHDTRNIGKDDIVRTGTVTARQDVNPFDLKAVSDCYGKPGQDMLHEMTEVYLGGVKALESGTDVPNSKNDYGNYLQIHKSAAVKQSGPVEQIKLINLEGKHIGFQWKVGPYVKEYTEPGY